LLSTRRIAAAAVAATALVPAASAQGATRHVTAGPPFKVAGVPKGSDSNAYFVKRVTIHVGDRVRWKINGFHTVTVPPEGDDPPPFIGQDASGTKISGVNDAAGNPFWFNGQPILGFTPALGPPGSFGKKLTYTGAKRIESGLPFAEHPKAFTVKFTKAGSYTYYCNIHAGMKGRIRVVAKSHKVPSAKADAKTLKAQVASTLKTAKALANTTVAPGNVSVGASGKGGVERYAMFPGTQTVPVGTTLKFSMSAKSVDDHTATFGPGDPEKEPSSYLGQIEQHFQNDPTAPSEAAYPSEPPGTVGSLSPTLHGNGFWNSGVMDQSSATPLQSSNSVTFTAPGTYNFYCLIHPFMHGTVVVQ
jgi:plastocyanin